MNFAFGKAIIIGVAVAAASFAGCSSDHRTPGSNSAIKGENVGELGIQLQVGDKTVNQVSYHLTNTVPGTLTYPELERIFRGSGLSERLAKDDGDS